MIPAAFKYAAPGTVQQAIELLATNEDAKVLDEKLFGQDFEAA